MISQHGQFPRRLLFMALLTAAALMAGCKRQPQAAAPPPPGVSVARPVQREVVDYDEYAGRISAVESVDVRARVSGYIETSSVAEGTIVKAGDPLFTLDVRPFQAELDQQRSSLAKAEAQQRYAQAEFNRIGPLRQSGAASELEFLQARQSLDQANAAVTGAQAAV